MTRIADEIQQRKPFDRPARELVLSVLRTADMIRHSLERGLAPWGVSPEQYNVLRILRGAGKGGHPTLAIAARMVSRSPNITRLIDKLLDKGLARRSRAGDDRRVSTVVITADGLRLLEEMDGAIDALLARFEGLPARDMRRAVDLLDEVRGRVRVETARESATLRKKGGSSRHRDAAGEDAEQRVDTPTKSRGR